MESTTIVSQNRLIKEKGDGVMVMQVTLSVNNAPIELDSFTQGFIGNTIGGILGGLKGTGEIQSLGLSIDEGRQVTIELNGASVPVNPFVNEIVKNTIFGMVSSLRGVGEINRLNIAIEK